MRILLARLQAVPIIALGLLSAPAAPQTPSRSTPTAEEQQTYEAFRAWVNQQPVEVQQAADDVVFDRYAAELRRQGRSNSDIASTIRLLEELGDRAEVERWNQILTSAKPRFNTAPNAFLVEMIKGMKPGRALDVGMGQGRNTLYLAQQGWDAEGFDPADRAVAAAEQQAERLGVRITTHVARAEDFDWGDAKWNLIVLCYVGGREYVGKAQRALAPGGMLILEAFHRDTTKIRPVGGAVVFDTNELLRLFADLRIIRYEDTNAVADFGLMETRVVRLAAIKP